MLKLTILFQGINWDIGQLNGIFIVIFSFKFDLDPLEFYYVKNKTYNIKESNLKMIHCDRSYTRKYILFFF